MTKHSSRERRYNAKCKCGAKFSTLAVRTQSAGAIVGPVARGACRFTEFEAAGRTFAGSDLLSDSLLWSCPCGRSNAARPVAGRYVAEKACDGRCMAATGHDCECACGGKNHGAAHAAA